ncbi:MAG: J domain-containing protein [Verrucomicrobiota bacterium]|nr:J domain-containing protein [Verrucomicrobiota bacterium]
MRVQLDAARAAWHRFQREDKPAFARWRAREFGALLSELRDVEVQIREQEALVYEVEMEMRRGFYDPHSALERVRVRRGNPAAAPPKPEPPRRDAGTERVLSEFEQEALFQDWVQKFIGTDPDKLDDEAYETTFEAFKTHMFRSRPAEPPPRVRNVADFVREHAPRAEEEAAPTPVDARVKELYRLLVRRLHPDLRADGNAAASALWHEVQEAYAATDIAQLEILLALSDIEADPFSEQTSLAQMRALVIEMERALFALEDSLRQARDEDAWDFARAGAVGGLHAQVERELRATLRMRSERLAILRQTIAAWSQPTLVRQAAYR